MRRVQSRQIALLLVAALVVGVYLAASRGRHSSPRLLKWVCAPKVEDVEAVDWDKYLLPGTPRIWIEDFSVVEGTVLVASLPGVWMSINKADGSVEASQAAALGPGFRRLEHLRLHKGYYLVYGYSGLPEPLAALQAIDPSPLLYLKEQGAGPSDVRVVAVELTESGPSVLTFDGTDVPNAERIGRSAWLFCQWLPQHLSKRRALLFHFLGSEGERVYLATYTAAGDRLVAIATSQSRTFVLCFDIETGEVLWSREIPGLTGRYGASGSHGTPIVGRVVNLHFSHGPDHGPLTEEFAALDLDSGRLLCRVTRKDARVFQVMWAEQKGSLLRHVANSLELQDSAAGNEVWRAELQPWRFIRSGLTEDAGVMFVPFEKQLLWVGVMAFRDYSKKPLLREAESDPLTDGVMCYRLSDGGLKATYGLDYNHLPNAPRPEEPEFLDHPGGLMEPGQPPILADGLLVLPPVRLRWENDWACAVAVFERESGELVDILWTDLLPDEWVSTRKLRVEVDGNELFLLTRDGRLWCFELPQAHPRPDAGE